MILAINTAQSKTVSIAFTSLKASLFAFISHYSAVSMPNTKCTESGRSYFQLLKALLPLCILVDLCSLIYFYFSMEFKKMQYYVFYFFHWIITWICVMGGLYNLFQNPQCQQSYSLVVFIISINVVYQVNTLIAMISDVYYVLKYLHFGSNLVWFALWYTTSINKCAQGNQTVIAFLHTGLSVANFVNFLFSKLLGRSFSSFVNGKTLISLSLFLMLLCYLLILLGGYIPDTCSSAKLFQKNYMKYGLIQLVSPILLLISLQQEVQNPQQIISQKREKMPIQYEYDHAGFFMQN